MTNLIFNAVDAMPEGGVITLRTRREENDVVFETNDTGTGMPEEVRARCLEPFFSTKAERGTGLGLSMVFGIIQRHEGTLEIESEEGKGTMFRIRFASQVDAFEASAGAHSRPTESLHILVVDDEPGTRDVVTKYLLADGHQVIAVASGAEALQNFQGKTFDLLLTGQVMPGMTGLQLASQIKEIKQDQLIILLTGNSDPTLSPGERPAGVDLVLQKPIPQLELRRAIARLIQPGGLSLEVAA